MPHFDPYRFDFFGFIQSLQSFVLYRGIFFLIIIGYIVLHAVVFAQIHSLNKIITLPVASTILKFISIGFIVVGFFLLAFMIQIHI